MLCSAIMQHLSGAADSDAVTKAVVGLKLEPIEAKGTLSSVHYILHSAAKYGVDAQTLMTESQQLGLPKGGFSACLFLVS